VTDTTEPLTASCSWWVSVHSRYTQTGSFISQISRVVRSDCVANVDYILCTDRTYKFSLPILKHHSVKAYREVKI